MHTFRQLVRTHRWWVLVVLLATAIGWPVEAQNQNPEPSAPKAQPRWLLGKAYHVPSEYTNQESGYFSIIEGKNGKLYIGCAKYGINAYLVEFNPLSGVMQMVTDVHRVIMTMVRGFAAQAKIHTRNNVGQLTGKIYFGTKQGYPEKGEKLTDYPGGYVMAYDPKTGETENFGLPQKHFGIISVTPDEHRNLVYISTCDDGRPIENSHFMVLDLKTKKYRDLGNFQHSYAFIILDHQGRAYHPVRGGKIARFDPASDQLEKIDVTVDGAPAPQAITKDGAILNWEASPDGKTLWCVEMSTNELFSFDLTAKSPTIPGKRHGPLLAGVKATDCRALCVGPTGKVWMGLSEQTRPVGPTCHLVSYTPGDKAPRDHGPVGVANPDYIKLHDENGKLKPWHHTLRKEKDGTMTPWQPLGIAAGADGSVNLLTLAPFTVIRFTAEQLK
jgi:sugar lactone lactonase YvrE